MRHFLSTLKSTSIARAAPPECEQLSRWIADTEARPPEPHTLTGIIAGSGTRHPVEVLERALTAAGWREVRIVSGDGSVVQRWVCRAGLRRLADQYSDRVEVLR